MLSSIKESVGLLSVRANVVGVIMLKDVLVSILGLEKPGKSDCCTGCFGSKGKKNLLSLSPIVLEAVLALDADIFDVLNCIPEEDATTVCVDLPGAF